MKEIKSGNQIVEEFFADIQKIDGVDNKIASTLLQLYTSGKFTNTSISNALSGLREGK
ncbi:MAG: hypothetical protein H7844_07195 [Nitrospirae bacterium YQR-1]